MEFELTPLIFKTNFTLRFMQSPTLTPLKISILLTYLIIGQITEVIGQEIENSPVRKNTIKYDFTSNLIYSNSLIFAYERLTKENQSFVITAGYQEFPSIANFGLTIPVRKNTSKQGGKLGFEYRFYLSKENKYKAPHGLYIGPYFTLHNFSNKRVVEVESNGNIEQAKLNTSLNITNVGFQLGYQFLFNNRWTVDLLLIGPSVSNYSFKANFDGNYSFDTDQIENEVILKIIDRFPLLGELIDEREIKSDGKLNAWSFGYRYQIHVGYHFGRKKK
jgi:hypothetical protein